MRKFLGILANILVISTLLSSFSALSFVGASEENEFKVTPYTPTSDKKVSNITSSLGVHLKLNAPFNGVNFQIATYFDKKTTADISVYKWIGTYADSTKESPLVTETLLLVDNKMQGITFDTLPAGEYLFTVSNSNKTPAIYYYSTVDNFKGNIYKDEFPSTVSVQYPNMQIIFTEERSESEYFLECEKAKDAIDGNHTHPAEYVIPSDSLINTHPVMPDTWVFTDGLGRTSLTNAEVGDPREDKTLAMFYWTWHIGGLASDVPINLQEYSEKYPDAMRDYNNKVWEGTSTYWWNESIYGYYMGNDPWVLRKQAELLTNAGVDVIFTDNTNGDSTWHIAYNALLKEWDDAMNDGLKTPKLSFMLPFGDKNHTKNQVISLYQTLYRQNRYQHLWYYLDGKPMLMAMQNAFKASASPLEKEIYNFFTFRKGQPSYTSKLSNYREWGWLSVYPQAKYYASGEDHVNGIVEQTTVGVSMNHDYELGLLAAMSGNNICGRSYTSDYENRFEVEGPEASKWGYNFAEQWNYALEIDPKVVFVTGWNEFRVGRYKEWPEGSKSSTTNAFPDQFNDEFSRDIEPTKGALKDHYYYQLVNFARQYKGCNPIPTPSGKTNIDISAGQEQWVAVEPYYAAYIGNTGHRDAAGYGDIHYTETSGRNDIIGAQIARDDEYVYFNVECASDITPYTDDLWMTLYLDTDQSNQGWETFEYVINKSKASENTVVLEKFIGNGYDSEKVADCEYKVDGRFMTVKVKKSDLGLTNDGYTINFAWTDNVHDEGDYSKFSGDIMDFYISGDVAPGARFKYSYIVSAESEQAPIEKPSTAGNLAKILVPAIAGAAVVTIGAVCAAVFSKKNKKAK